MLIDWFTVGAQMLNFIILVGLMKRFLYKPILLAIDAREERVARELADAEVSKTEAAKERDDFRAKNARFDQERAVLMTQVTDEANAERERLTEEARKQAASLRVELRATFRAEAQHLRSIISHRTEQEAYAVARKALVELASSSLEERLCAVFLDRVRQLEGAAKAQLAEAIRTATTPALVQSAFELSDGDRATIQQVVDNVFATKLPLRFKTEPQAICGIAFSINGQKVAWTFADYLTSLEKDVIELIDQQVKADFEPSSPREP